MRQLRFALGLLAALLLTSAASAGGFQSDQTVVQVVSTNVQGKNVYIPGTIVVVGGKKQSLSLFNTTDVPHGFRIDGLDLETVLPPGEEHVLELPELKGGHVYQIHCQLHPAHRTATLVVLKAPHGKRKHDEE
jgi:heme/copper-type cytochrome/quinol oxidase subunit 2